MKFGIAILLTLSISSWLAPEIRAQMATNLAASVSHTDHLQPVNGGEIITREGVAYKGVQVQEVLPDGLVIKYSLADRGLGMAKLNFKDLSDELRQQFGYNPTNATRFEKEEMRAEGEWRANWIAEDERAQAKLAAEEIAEAETQA
ncbi:MAG TPA: hypothetical protein VMA13_07015, partial [Candidatus Saccharimonadales bacterium]|nr:hypothetical protein [Candidatus Saccharimonadales bacterium]